MTVVHWAYSKKSLADNETNYFPSKTLLIDTAENDKHH